MPPYLVIIVRSVLSFIALLLVCRVAGKKFDVVLPVVFGGLAAVVSLDRNVGMSDGITSLVTWGVLTVVLGFITIWFPEVQNTVIGKPTVLIERGKVLEQNLKKMRMTTSNMMSLLREKDAFKLTEVEFAILESDGQLSVMKKSDSMPVTPTVAGITVQNEEAPKTVIQGGTIMTEALGESGRDFGWLMQEVQKQGVRDYDDVFLAQIDAKGNLYVDLKDDTLMKSPSEPTQQTKLMLLASLKKTQADLEHFTLETKNQRAKTAYEQSATSLKQVIEQVQTELKK